MHPINQSVLRRRGLEQMAHHRELQDTAARRTPDPDAPPTRTLVAVSLAVRATGLQSPRRLRSVRRAPSTPDHRHDRELRAPRREAWARVVAACWRPRDPRDPLRSRSRRLCGWYCVAWRATTATVRRELALREEVREGAGQQERERESDQHRSTSCTSPARELSAIETLISLNP